jgi:hypothetical protein
MDANEREFQEIQNFHFHPRDECRDEHISFVYLRSSCSSVVPFLYPESTLGGGQTEVLHFFSLAEDGMEVVGEAGIGRIDAVGTVDDGLAFGKKPGDGEGHRDAVITV